MRCKYRTVLAIDGGGIRGVIPLTLLKHIEKTCYGIDPDIDMINWIDVFSGTSTGAIISGALMLRDENERSIFTPDRILDLYLKRGHQIFSRDVSLHSAMPEYPLKLILENNFGEVNVSGISKHFLFVSYDMNADSPFIFTDRMDMYRNLSLSKIMMACSAVPGYFPPVQLGDKQLADGILTAKNPSKLAYEYAKMYYPNDPIVVISLGTGELPKEKHDMIELEMQRVHLEMEDYARKDRNLLYFRLQPDLRKANHLMDDTGDENLENLMHDANTFIEENNHVFDRLFKLMTIRADAYQ
ncbi:Patatin-like phospholipase [Lishizhenia tianjinensis]|uniref:Patatin-like phospholipase n=1 Tax=Lishizhenia tianjinensis TaxID=477690 RepID=A0A1I6Y4V8_9FLAO|nr:patatin-like phospholipase family protein [Lishizhenia tianjinensis]SFT45569.1 Patatin-like phospholipase [Lishizhenia tianjinensis]